MHSYEVENTMDILKELSESAVTGSEKKRFYTLGIPHDELGKALIAVCVLSSRTKDHGDLEEKLISKLHTSLSSFKIPKRLVFGWLREGRVCSNFQRTTWAT